MNETGHACPCGDVHELAAGTRQAYDSVTAGLSGTVKVQVAGVGAWLVPRIFIAVHGLNAADLPSLAGRYGFETAQ